MEDCGFFVCGDFWHVVISPACRLLSPDFPSSCTNSPIRLIVSNLGLHFDLEEVPVGRVDSGDGLAGFKPFVELLLGHSFAWSGLF